MHYLRPLQLDPLVISSGVRICAQSSLVMNLYLDRINGQFDIPYPNIIANDIERIPRCINGLDCLHIEGKAVKEIIQNAIQLQEKSQNLK